MQQPPEANESAREALNTTPLPHSAKISPLTVQKNRWTTKRARLLPGRVAPIAGALLVVLALLVICVTSPLGRGILAHLSAHGRPPAPPPSAAQGTVVGHIYFESSGQYTADGSQGVSDELQVDLAGISPPDVGMSYYGWLLADRRAATQPPALALGALPVSGGGMHVLYTAPDHRNLILLAGSFLITEETAGSQPPQPNPDQSTWRYRADFPQMPDPGDQAHHYSLLDHLRHLLAQDPTIGPLGLHGGLTFWFFRNAQKVLESASAARDYWGQAAALALMRSHFALILDYLDGADFAWQDLPAVSQAQAGQAPFAARVGLLEVRPGQVPPGYVYHIDLHLRGVIAAPGATAGQRTLAGEITATLQMVTSWLIQLRSDARQLAAMSNAQLQQPQARVRLNDMYTMAQYAFIGQPNLSGSAELGGASLISDDVLRLATLAVDALSGRR